MAEFWEMLQDLRAIQLDCEAGKSKVVRSIGFKPFCSAIASHVTAFLRHGTAVDNATLAHLTQSWWGAEGEGQSWKLYKKRLVGRTKNWMQNARQHADGFVFIAKHLLDVVALWPMQPNPISARKLAWMAKRNAKRRVFYTVGGCAKKIKQ